MTNSSSQGLTLGGLGVVEGASSRLGTEGHGVVAASCCPDGVRSLRDVVKCERCKGEGWMEPIEGYDGSWVTSRPCLRCKGEGFIDACVAYATPTPPASTPRETTQTEADAGRTSASNERNQS